MNEELQNFFCVKASERIEKIITSRGKSFFEIYSENSNIISWIVSGKRTKRNPYLLTDTAVQRINESVHGQELSDKENRYQCRVISWGDDEEIGDYIPEMMKLIVKNLRDEQQLIFDETLMDDIYFAETIAYTEILNEYNSHFLDVDMEQLYTEDVPISRHLAEMELLEAIEEDFKNEFIKFLDSSKYVRTKVNGKDEYVNKGITFKNQFGCDDIVNLFLRVVNAHKLSIEESIGHRVYSIVKKDVSKLDSLIEEELVYDTVYAPYRQDKIREAEFEFQHGIIKAGQDYIKSLYDTHKSRNETWNKLRKEGEI
ncbi:TPA: hypothetical protein VJW12_000962 [Streptococcus pyogenes]|uniref:hypothetical protein n=1 Tax=Streptococcus pyogenes TaxID=1314 RepID=UPI0007C8369E|nr:hypothetical protein [Streptococcus pyogenes]OAF79872.1 hypothetical protein AXK21_08435 [Streptococcus pyogenes]TYK78512.1 hypothetical protein E0F46_06395 [Streptococcus pyogenes]VGS04488.1 Uncharacterised protein [Streptococcus pyogenes]VGU42056.1 Uncharacterised protein [Streptococcus pyogenes]VGU74774.1 Uncharacterised protein [Streptococcus pyogenes]